VGKRVLVTGGAGFIGGNLVRDLQKCGDVDSVVVIDDLSTGFRENLPGDVEFHEASILDVDALNGAARGVDSIVHLAALGSVPRSVKAPLTSHAVNATGTLNVLEAARTAGNAHVVLASSSSVYGANPTLPKVESMVCQPMSPYAVTKLATESYAVAYNQVYDLPTLPFRFFNVFGPMQRPGHVYAAVVPVFLDSALRNEPLPINGDGTNSRDFTFVGTVTEVLVDAVVRRVVGPPTNLAFGSRTSLLELVEEIRRVTGREVAVHHRDARPGDVKHSQANNDRLRSMFPDVRPVQLRPGLEVTWDWMVANTAQASSA
jgi:UDP-glucose 4-epimerase